MASLSAARSSSVAVGRRVDVPYIIGWVILLLALAVSLGPFAYLFSISLMDN
jgi:hypothetical protein